MHSGPFKDLVIFCVSAACGWLVQMNGAWLERDVSCVDLEELGECSLMKETLCATEADLGAFQRKYLEVMMVCGP